MAVLQLPAWLPTFWALFTFGAFKITDFCFQLRVFGGYIRQLCLDFCQFKSQVGQKVLEVSILDLSLTSLIFLAVEMAVAIEEKISDI